MVWFVEDGICADAAPSTADLTTGSHVSADVFFGILDIWISVFFGVKTTQLSDCFWI